jgi:ComF family protein
LIFPLYCPVCKSPWEDGDGWLCPKCWNDLPPASSGSWSHNAALKGKLMVAYQYGEAAQKVVHQMKFNHRIDIARKFGRMVIDRFGEELEKTELAGVVPVPLHPVRVRERGYDQDLAISQEIAAALKLPLFGNIIKRVKNTPPQSRLSDAERRINLKNAFAPVEPKLRQPLPEILLIDDVIHTGATVMGCISALKAVGADKVTVLAVCG